jgi:PPP family 3-phenylpropionic acid transporter
VFFQVQGLLALMLFGFLAQSTLQAAMPLTEGAALRAPTAEPGALSYGVARALGSCAFMLANIAGGALIGAVGISAAPAWMVSCFILASVVALLLLREDPAPAGAQALGYRARLRQGGALFQRRAFVFALAAGALIQCAHAFYYGFSALIWRAQGVSDALIGWLWAFAVMAEIVLLWFLARIEKRFTPETLMLLGAIGAVLRWLLMAPAPPAIALWPLQALHALSFAAAHVGALRIVQRETPPEIAGLGLTFYAAATATSLGLATLAAGALYDAAGARGYLAMAAIAAAGALVAYAARRRLQ